MYKISVLTAVHKNLSGLLAIYESISEVLSSNINWVIKDSGECKATKEWIATLNMDNIIFITGKDEGIYSALNSGIKRCSDFYIVCGSDDLIFPSALVELHDIVNNINDNCELLINSVVIDGRVICPGPKPCLTISLKGWIVSHSVGCLIKTDLHEKFGCYDESYSILADSKFLTLLYENKIQFYEAEDIIGGIFSTDGISSINKKQRAAEAYRYHVDLGYNRFLQYLLYYLRVLFFAFVECRAKFFENTDKISY